MPTPSLDSLLDTLTEDVFETQLQPVPPGVYEGRITELDAVAGTSKKDGSPYEALVLTWTIRIPADVAAQIGREEAKIRQQVFIRRDASGRIDPKQNLQLGRIREALGQNVPGPWMPRMLLSGCAAKVTVGQRTSGENVYNEVERVEAL